MFLNCDRKTFSFWSCRRAIRRHCPFIDIFRGFVVDVFLVCSLELAAFKVAFLLFCLLRLTCGALAGSFKINGGFDTLSHKINIKASRISERAWPGLSD